MCGRFAVTTDPAALAEKIQAINEARASESAGPNYNVAPTTTITTDAVGELAEIHDRMPLIVTERDWDRWLDPDAPADLELLAAPPDVRGIEMREISTLVNNVRNNGPELLAPAEPQPEQARLL